MSTFLKNIPILNLLVSFIGFIGTLMIIRFLPNEDYINLTQGLVLIMFITSLGGYGLTLDFPNWKFNKFITELPNLMFINFFIAFLGTYVIYFFELVPIEYLFIIFFFWLLVPLNSINKALETEGFAIDLAQFKLKLGFFLFFVKVIFIFFLISPELVFFSSVLLGLCNFFFFQKLNFSKIRRILSVIFKKFEFQEISKGIKTIRYELLFSSLCGIFFLKADAFMIENWSGSSEKIVFEYLVCFPLVDIIFIISSGFSSQSWETQYKESLLPSIFTILKIFALSIAMIIFSPIYFYIVTGKIFFNPDIIFLSLSAFVVSFGIFQTAIISKEKDYLFQLIRNLLGVILFLVLFLSFRNNFDPIYLSFIKFLSLFFLVFVLPVFFNRYRYILPREFS